jgi:uncharacterized protein YcfL
MKKTIIALTLLSLVGCTSNETNTPPPVEGAVAEAPIMDEADSIIMKAQQSADELAAVTNETTEKVSSNVHKLTEQIKVYEQQTKTIKAVKQVVVHDTVYIEKKKNFWGKEKTTINKVSDSTSTETTDSTTIK